ncbi:family 43 glycosylhydrolase [Streptomyces sp. RLB1-33]|uniref:family 43 glycosylhydrolase n=1 Tax=Streptomyces mirabilis TaxID=68239 RepID=UPI0024958B4A|nr:MULTISPECIES: family 43 glycosylhydrolase [Streptomyces]
MRPRRRLRRCPRLRLRRSPSSPAGRRVLRPARRPRSKRRTPPAGGRARSRGPPRSAGGYFEWFPGVPVHRSTDLVHWDPADHILDRTDPLDLRGVPDSADVWAPSLSYHEGRF